MHYLYYLQEPFRRIHRRAIKHVRRFTTDLDSQSMRNEIGMLVNNMSDPAEKKAFIIEMQMFSKLLNRYIAEASQKLNWEKVHSLATNQIYHYDQLPRSSDEPQLFKKLAVLKVNGGLGTSMGLDGAKSALEVKNGFTFLDFAIQQIACVNTNHSVDIPLLLMTSFNTHDDTLRISQKYNSKQVRIKLFMQSKYPAVTKDSLLPCPKDGQNDEVAWYPPGHGDLYTALYRSGELNRLIKEGKEYLFVSNCDNLGAVVDSRILRHAADTRADFIMEVTDRTNMDIETGTLIDYDGTIRLLEIGQVPSDNVKDFTSVRQFKDFNTNNLWINLRALKKIMDKGGMDLEIIGNPKVTDDGRSILQLETAAGAAIRYFSNAHGINVPRSRFTPVRSCADLLLLKSDLFALEDGRPVLSKDRLFNTIPVIKLGNSFQKAGP
ncbi:UTP--glucose-1-phosphate uridylyltransferase, partial [Termitomyces sp. T112]